MLDVASCAFESAAVYPFLCSTAARILITVQDRLTDWHFLLSTVCTFGGDAIVFNPDDRLDAFRPRFKTYTKS